MPVRVDGAEDIDDQVCLEAYHVDDRQRKRFVGCGRVVAADGIDHFSINGFAIM